MPGEQVNTNRKARQESAAPGMGRAARGGTRASRPEVDGAPVPREPGLLGVRSPRCHWSCSRSLSPRSCRSRWCSQIRRCWNVLRPRLLAAPVERCGEATEAIRDPGEADSFPLSSLRSLPALLLLERTREPCRSSSCVAHGTMLHVLWQPGWQRSLGENGYVYIHLVCVLFC